LVLNRKKLFNRIKEFSIFYIKAIQKNRSQKIHDTSKAKEAMFYVFRGLAPINATATESEVVKWKASSAAKSSRSLLFKRISDDNPDTHMSVIMILLTYYQPKSFFLQIKFLTINISIIDINNDNSAIEKMNKLCEGIMYLNRLIIHSLRWFDKIVSRIQNATPTTPTNQIQLTLSKLPSLSYC